MARLETSARRILETCFDGAETAGRLSAIRRLLGWSPLNTVALRCKIAQQVRECAGQPV